MSLLSSLLSGNTDKPKIDENASPRPDYEPSYGRRTKSGETVSVFTSQTIATTYRCKNIISDAAAGLPFKQYRREGGNTQLVDENPTTNNIPYLMQIQVNDWGWTPFHLVK